MVDNRQRQIEREAAARQLALGQRARVIEAGHLGPVLKRWINADVVPIAALLRDVARAYLAGDMKTAALLLDSPSVQLSDKERPLTPLMHWVLRGRSPGRADTQDTTHAEDLALSFLATVVTRIAQDRCTISAALALAADSLRDTVQGQFIVSVQGAAAMQAFRERHAERWKQRKSLNRICARLHAQVRPELARLEKAAGGGGEGFGTRGKKVLYVLAHGEERRIAIRPPDALDWEVMSLCWRDERDGGTQPYRSLWLALAGLILAATQKVSGWFDVAGETTKRRHHTRTTKYLVLSEKASEAIQRDIERWVSIGFAPQPMIVPPENGDYLTVKHRPVTGQRPPMGLITDPRGSSGWEQGATALSGTPWTVNTHTLTLLDDHPELWDPEDTNQLMRVAEHRRIASEEAFYLPTCMDFRGRIYYRTPWVTPQSGDLGKALLCFPPGIHGFIPEDAAQALEMHLASLYGNGLDKAPLETRSAWLRSYLSGPPGSEDISKAEKPISLGAAVALIRNNEWDRIPVQLDGTCNGLQHLTALLRDQQAAPHVNLTASSLEDPPADIYGTVAERVKRTMARDAFLPEVPAWQTRMDRAGVLINRKLTKRPVMVLPYGGTLDAVSQAVKAAVVEQLHSPTEALLGTVWHEVEADGLGAMKDRDLKDHPLFNSDCRDLARLIWDSIHPVIPRAMKFMKALQDIGSWLGERAIAWQTPHIAHGSPLWVIQAKSKAARKQVTMRGFHLPDMVRRLTLMANSNEIDPRANRTGIVANFIHSLDAAHLAASIAAFRASGGGCVGSVHDCLLVRPSEAALMGRCLRETFAAIYTGTPLNSGQSSPAGDPLWLPVKTTLDGETWQEYGSWYSLAEAASVDLPALGTYDPNEVKQSAWFFS